MPLKERLAHIPDKPGVYLFRDRKGKVIYVGKAASLRDRVRSYLNPPGDPKTSALVGNIADVEFIEVPTETEALILESDLVKRYRPRYNIRLKDDKSWLYIHVTDDEFPQIRLTRKVLPDGGRYYGPFTSARAVRRGYKVLRRAFKLRGCRQEIRKGRVCLDYEIGLCSGPCAGHVTREEYMEAVGDLDAFLTGRHEDLLEKVKTRMQELSRDEEFEQAGILRDRISAMEGLIEGQHRTIPLAYTQDVVGLARGESIASVQVFAVRDGRILGRENITLEGVEGEEDPAVLASFLAQYYSGRRPPREVVVGARPPDAGSLEPFLSSRRGKKVRLTVPKRGKKLELLRTAEKNAGYALLREEEHERVASLKRSAVAELRGALGLSVTPHRIEAFDISNISGKTAVGSMVSFKDGAADKAGYRRYKIRWTEGPDDPGMMREVITRRYSRHPLPDLVLVDGGPGQVGAALEALSELGMEGAQVAGLAKREEVVYLPGKREPLRLPEDSRGLLLLREIRDEAHRFAVSYHRKLRARQMTASVLDDIPGIGKEKKMALLRHFGSVERIRRATVEELMEVRGIGKSLARAVKEGLE